MFSKEKKFIDYISKKYCVYGKNDSVYGIGDDCAVFECRNKEVVTCDMLIENTHFSFDYMSPYEVGYKSAAVNISDISAMGALPKYAFLSVGINNFDIDFLDQFYQGLSDFFKFSDTLILGGDTVRSPFFAVNITMIGETDNPIMRNGAKTDDLIIVSDYCGLSHAGFDILTKYKNSSKEKYSDLTQFHKMPFVDSFLGFDLSKTGKIHSMMDISDGLCNDLLTLCKESSKGAEIFLENFRIHPLLYEYTEKENKNIYDYLTDNFEDYSLLFTVSPGDIDKITEILNNHNSFFSIIGKITEEKKINWTLNGKKFNPPKTWEHF